MLKTVGKLLAAVVVGALVSAGLYFVAQPGVRFADQYHALVIGMDEEAVHTLFGRPPDYVCSFRESSIVYYSQTPLGEGVPGERPEVAPYLEAIPWIAGAVQILVDKTGRVKAFTWSGEEHVIHSTEGDSPGNSLSLLDEAFFR